VNYGCYRCGQTVMLEYKTSNKVFCSTKCFQATELNTTEPVTVRLTNTKEDRAIAERYERACQESRCEHCNASVSDIEECTLPLHTSGGEKHTRWLCAACRQSVSIIAHRMAWGEGTLTLDHIFMHISHCTNLILEEVRKHG
jgi:hypothetical protein